MSQELGQEYKKEGYVPLLIQKGAHKFLVYIEEGMPSFAAFDASLDVTFHIREIYRSQVQKALDEQKQAGEVKPN